MANAKIDAEARAEIEKLRRIEQRVFGPHHGRTDFYDYLGAVWELYDFWKRKNRIAKRTARFVRLYKIRIRRNTHPFRVIIDASSKQKSDVKSEWTRALKYIEAHRGEVEKVGFRAFLQQNGGPAGCAAKIAKRRAARRNTQHAHISHRSSSLSLSGTR